jgi:recombinational DNA repair protein (RecF pathway)
VGTFLYTLPNCTATARFEQNTFNKTGIYDATNSDAYCHTTKTTVVANSVELYTNGICSGYSHHFITIPGNALNASFAKIQMPGVTLAMMEKVGLVERIIHVHHHHPS